MSRFVAFARSVIPRDPSQLFFLAGSILLLISVQLRCYPLLGYALGSFGLSFAIVYRSWLLLAFLVFVPVCLDGAAGLYICSWPGTHPMRRILGFVLLPALAGVSLVVCRYLYLSQQVYFPKPRVFQNASHSEAWGFNTVWSLGPAVHMSALGLIFILIFLGRLATGNSSLPISLAHLNYEPPDPDEPRRRLLLFVWLSTIGMSALGLLASRSLVGLYDLIGQSFGYRSLPSVAAPLSSALSAAVLASAAAWAVGKDRWTEFRRFIRPAESKFVALSVIFPIAIRLVLNLAAYTSDRARWAVFQHGRAALPLFTSYVHFPNSYYLWYAIAAGFEEVIWRGFLQPRFVQRYGMM